VLPPVRTPAVATRYALVCLPSIEWGFRMQRPQQLARRFARAGHEVLFARHAFGAALSARAVEPGVEEIELPGTPGANPYRDRMHDDDARRMADALLAHVAQRGLGRFVLVVQLPYWAPLAARLRALAGCDVVYDCMDLHAGFSSNTAEALTDEARLFAESDVVVCSSDLLVEHARPHAKAVALVRNGVDHEHFAQVPARSASGDGRLTIGYYGAIADWFDSALVAGVARLRPQWRIVLVGSTWSADTAPLAAAPNVELTGEKPYAELPALIADWHCCIIPFLHTPLTAATNPVKVYEMLAAGKPVVSVGLPELAAMAADGLVALAEGPEAFVAAIERETARDDAQRVAARRAFAAGNTWEARERAFDAAIAAVEPLVSVVVVTYNNRDLNALCLASLTGDTDWPAIEVGVVDNASQDGTPELLREAARRDARVRVVLNDDNRGFSAANNQGAALARGRYLCFLNNDTVVHGGWLRTLVGHLRRHAHLGLVGPVTNAIGNEAKIPVGYGDLAGMPAWADAHCAAHRGELDAIPMLAFFCVVVPRDVWRRVGPLDERFGAGMFEDDDYNRRVRDAGFDVRLARDSFVHHWQRASFKLLGEDEYLRIYRENQARYADKWRDADGGALAPLRKAAASAPATVVFAPSVGWAIPLAQRPHHIARVLAQDGYAVVFDCSNAADDVDTLREVEPRLFLYKGPAEALAGLPRPVLWTFSYNVDYRDRFGAGARLVYDWIDDLAVFPYDQRKLAAMHERALREADVVVSVAHRLHERALGERPDARYVPNGVEEGRFDREPEPNPALSDPAFARLVADGRPIAGYYGALAHWFDYALLAQAARLRPDWQFVLIGPDHDGSLARSGVAELANVHALGPRHYAALPGYLHRFDVATIPFAINDITLATSPLKLYEYVAAGKPVVSTPMPECMAFPEVRIAADAAQFVAALDAARADGRDAAHAARLRAL
ncbi:MAG: glycosyltransferase, partial [Burkholderiales bacterium]|nr:glycosyltransferase [Burkholderiales bacterium]